MEGKEIRQEPKPAIKTLIPHKCHHFGHHFIHTTLSEDTGKARNSTKYFLSQTLFQTKQTAQKTIKILTVRNLLISKTEPDNLTQLV